MLKSNCIQLQIHDAIAVIRIEIPNPSTQAQPQTCRNAVAPTPAEQLADVCQALNEDPTIRAVVLTNASSPSTKEGWSLPRTRYGDGGDSPNSFWHENANPFSQSSPNEDPESALQRLRVASRVANLNVPTIAAIQGRAWNQGLELVLACDLRLAAEDATFGISSLAEGFIPWDGGTQRLPRIIGRARALDLLLTGRSLSARDALEIGLLNAVAPEKDLKADAVNLARTIADAAPIAVRYLKEAVHKGLDMSLPQGLNLEADLSFILQTTRDRQHGIQSFLTKTTPKFTGQ